MLRGSTLELHVEIKTDAVGNAYKGFEEQVIRTIERMNLRNRVILTCFVPEVLETIRALRPKMPVLASLDRRSAEMMGGIQGALDRFDRIPGCIVAVEKVLLAQTLGFAGQNSEPIASASGSRTTKPIWLTGRNSPSGKSRRTGPISPFAFETRDRCSV